MAHQKQQLCSSIRKQRGAVVNEKQDGLWPGEFYHSRIRYLACCVLLSMLLCAALHRSVISERNRCVSVPSPILLKRGL